MSLERNSKLVTRKFIQYLIPSILMIFAMQFGSLIDGVLIGNLIGSEALAATALVLPIIYVIQIPGFALGVGGSIVVANLFGKRNIDGAKKVFSFCLIAGVAVSAIFAVLSFFVSYPLAAIFGESSLEYSYPYVFMYLLTDPIVAIALLVGSFMAVDNSPKLSSASFIIANATKIGFEVLFIYAFKSFGGEMYGAALSTAAGYIVGLLTVIIYVRSKKRLLSLTFKIKGVDIKGTLRASATSALNLLLTAVQMLVVNIFLGQRLTDPQDLIIYGVVANMVFVFDLFCGGIVNIIPTLCGLFYGEKDYYSLRSITKKIYFINLIVTGAVLAFVLLLPNVYTTLFGYDSSNNKEYIMTLFALYGPTFIPYEISKFTMNYYPSIDKPIPSIITVFLRELVIVIPVTLVLLFTNGLIGYCAACLITETATVIITYIYIFIYNKVKKNKYHGIFMFEKGDAESYDVTIDNDLSNAAVISEQLTNFALSKNVPNRESQIVGLAAEEIVNNIITYGYKKGKRSYIDVNLKLINDKLLLRIRDDGMPFDPTKYEFDADENYSTSGIQLIEKLTDKMTYMRVLNLNNTIFEININKGESK